MANYIKIKRVKLTQSCIITAVEGNWTPEEKKDLEKIKREIKNVTNFIWSYLHQFFDDSHGLKARLKPLRRPFD